MDPIQEIQWYLISKYGQFLRIHTIYTNDPIRYKNHHLSPKIFPFSLDEYHRELFDIDDNDDKILRKCEFCDRYRPRIQYFRDRITANIILVCPYCVGVCQKLNSAQYMTFQNEYILVSQFPFIYVFQNEILFISGKLMKLSKKYLVSKLKRYYLYDEHSLYLETYDEQFAHLFTEHMIGLLRTFMLMREYTIDDIAAYISRIMIEMYPQKCVPTDLSY
jgi:hypothetical protein